MYIVAQLTKFFRNVNYLVHVGIYSERNESSPRHYIHLVKLHFNIILPSISRSHKLSFDIFSYVPVFTEQFV